MFKNLLNHVWRKPQPQTVQQSAATTAPNTTDHAEAVSILHALENHFVLHVEPEPQVDPKTGMVTDKALSCDICPVETNNCRKLHLAGHLVCVCPRKDFHGFRRNKVASRFPKD